MKQLVLRLSASMTVTSKRHMMPNMMMPSGPRIFSVGTARHARPLAIIALCGAMVSGLIGCSALDVNNPSVIQESSLDNATGADYLWSTARWHFADAVSMGGMASGMLADEFFIDQDPARADFVPVDLDLRHSEAAETSGGQANNIMGYIGWQKARTDAAVAIPRVRAYASAPTKPSKLSELFAIQGFAALRLAEDICPGFPLHTVVNFKPVYGPPLTTSEAFTHAAAEFDSALVYATDSLNLQYLAKLGKARALLGMGKFAEAGVLAATIPTGYVRTVKSPDNWLQFSGVFRWEGRFAVADREGGNGLDFRSAKDPRVQTVATQKALYGDTSQFLYASAKYPETLSPITLASGVEARLIEAEVALKTSAGSWLSILNELRTDGTFTTKPNDGNPALTDTLWNAGTGGVAGLAPLSAPAGLDAQVNLVFRERAFWLFATGHRLGDLRRLMQHYGRSAATIFPVGSYRAGAETYGTATSIPFNGNQERIFNPANTGCTAR